MIFLIGEGGEEDGRSQVYSLSANSLVLVFNKTIKAVAIWYSLRRIQFVLVRGIMLLSSQKALPRPNMPLFACGSVCKGSRNYSHAYLCVTMFPTRIKINPN